MPRDPVADHLAGVGERVFGGSLAQPGVDGEAFPAHAAYELVLAARRLGARLHDPADILARHRGGGDRRDEPAPRFAVQRLPSLVVAVPVPRLPFGPLTPLPVLPADARAGVGACELDQFGARFLHPPA